MTVISPVWKHKGSPSDPATYPELSVPYLLGKLLALSYLHHQNEESYCQGWLAEEQAGSCLGHCMEDHQLLLTYLLLAASHQCGPLAMAFLNL